jgi:hypothetical protein
MKAAAFYSHFLEAFDAKALGLEKLAGKAPKFRRPVAVGTMQLAFEVNPKSSGLLPDHFPGEFRLALEWQRPERGDRVVLFQYTTDAEAQAYAQLQREAELKFLRQPGKRSMRALFKYAGDAQALPVANHDEWCHYFDAADIQAWARWYQGVLAEWFARFYAKPETFDDWCWRVLWPHLERAAS